jgi:hypothetical protein
MVLECPTNPKAPVQPIVNAIQDYVVVMDLRFTGVSGTSLPAGHDEKIKMVLAEMYKFSMTDLVVAKAEKSNSDYVMTIQGTVANEAEANTKKAWFERDAAAGTLKTALSANGVTEPFYIKPTSSFPREAPPGGMVGGAQTTHTQTMASSAVVILLAIFMSRHQF